MADTCPQCGTPLELTSTLDVDDYTQWYDGCPNENCDWLPFDWSELGFDDDH